MKIFTLLVAVFLTASLFSQSPEKMSYQAVIRNASNNLISSKTVGMKISILQGLADGTIVYAETQTPTTNANGLVSIEIGNGTVVSGNFTTIDWTKGPYFLKTETDPAGGTNYTITGTSQLLSVPYALHAKTAESVTGTITETDPVYSSSIASNITATDTTKWNNKLDTETQTLNDVLTQSNSANNKSIINLANPVNDQDAATKAYVDALLIRVKALEDAAESEVLNNGFTDYRDGNHYNAVKIGNQIWMAENLKYLPTVAKNSEGSFSLPLYYVYDYNGNNITEAKAISYYNTYGVLYNWPAAMAGSASSSTTPSGVQGVCPAGWHLPSDAEWSELTASLGESVAGSKLKESGTTHWLSPNTNASNATNFSALPGGDHNQYGLFSNAGRFGNWWSATEIYNQLSKAWFRKMFYNQENVSRIYNDKEQAYSVRCVRN
ncbi:MAG TPA: fibrobacter succinogenes major paralogous domain-containing protein [Bacteroidales bacterium]|nr:fibrobacter succinogenes major paralogous domain-containing protein [Bacteroidales bacterium]